MTILDPILLDLSEKIEVAGPDAQYDLLGDTWDALGQFRRWSPDQAGAFGKLMDDGGFESAAMLMVPSGCGFNLDRYWNREGERWSCHLSFGGLPDNPRQVLEAWDCQTAGLATASACVRAQIYRGNLL